MQIIFQGGEADAHRIDLYEGSESLAGLARASTLVAHYISTSQVRFRAPYSNQLQYYLTGAQDGSLTILISEISRIANEAQAAAARMRASRLLGRVVRRATGQEAEGPLTVDGLDIPAGDIDALAEAATPGLQRAHRWIDQGNKSITIRPGHGQEFNFNTETKEYLEAEEVSPQEDIQDVSVGALNVNSRNGRVFFHDLGRTVPFWVPRDATDRTIPTLSRYLTQYAEKTGATVNIRFRRVRYPDGRLKRLIVSDCYAIAGLE